MKISNENHQNDEFSAENHRQYDYFYGEEALQFSFYRVPKLLITSPEFRHISNDAKLLYGLFLDRSCLSISHGGFQSGSQGGAGSQKGSNFIDSQNRAFIYYTIEDIMNDLGIGKGKAVAAVKELEKSGLIEKKRMGLGKPNIIYVKSCFKPLPMRNSQKSENRTSGSSNIETQEVHKTKFMKSASDTSESTENEPLEFHESECNNTNLNHINISDTNLSNQNKPSDKIDVYMEIIKENIEYSPERFLDTTEQELFTNLYNLICEVVCIESDVVRINGKNYPYEIAKSVFLKLRFEHVQYVMESMKKTSTQIKNIKNYLTSALYNSYSTLGYYYQQEFNHDKNE